MRIRAIVRPRLLKRGKEKAFAAMLAEQDLRFDVSDVVGRLELDGDQVRQFVFLSHLYQVFTDGGEIIVNNLKGEFVGSYASKGMGNDPDDSPVPNQEVQA